MGDAKLPALPQKKRETFCTKCGHSAPTESTEKAAICPSCGYMAFVHDVPLSDDEVLAYGQAAYQAGRDAALEEAAKVCEQHLFIARKPPGDYIDGQNRGIEKCLDAIRKLKGPQP